MTGSMRISSLNSVGTKCAAMDLSSWYLISTVGDGMARDTHGTSAQRMTYGNQVPGLKALCLSPFCGGTGDLHEVRGKIASCDQLWKEVEEKVEDVAAVVFPVN